MAAMSACGDSSATKRADGALVLEVGGEQTSLREALRAAGVRLPSQGSDPAERRDVAPRDDAAREGPATRGEAPPASPPEPPPEPWFVVELAERQTLIHLARKHLGDGNRFREILALNGWSEADSRRLRVGQQVKIPRAPDAAPPARR